jgi:hypothetical protein
MVGDGVALATIEFNMGPIQLSLTRQLSFAGHRGLKPTAKSSHRYAMETGEITIFIFFGTVYNLFNLPVTATLL